MKKCLWYVTLICVVFLSRNLFESHASINSVDDYVLLDEPNIYYEIFRENVYGADMGSLQVVSSECAVDYLLCGEPNTYYEIYPAIVSDIDNYNHEKKCTGGAVNAEPTPFLRE